MRKIIAAINVSLDGFVEGPNGELDWAMAEDEAAWANLFEMLTHVDTFILGRVMYPEYEKYWLKVLADPSAGSKNDLAYARLADRTPHVVVSKTLDNVAWKTTRIVRDIDEIRKLKQQPGKDMQVVGGATMISSLMNAGLIDQLELAVNPLLLGGGKPLFKDVKQRHALKLLRTKPLDSGKVVLTYDARAAAAGGAT